jgi:hypothetical protein
LRKGYGVKIGSVEARLLSQKGDKVPKILGLRELICLKASERLR